MKNKVVSSEEMNIVLYDGSCKLCNHAVRFISRRDRKRKFCFIPLESEKASEYLRLYSGDNKNGSMMLITSSGIYRKTDAVLRILRQLDGLWQVMYLFIIFPRFIRDPLYDLISRYRYEWFGPCLDCPDPRPC